MITGCFAMYSITVTITCNHKHQRLQITFRLLKTCNRLHVIMITGYNYNRSDCNWPKISYAKVSHKVAYANSADSDKTAPEGAV